MKKDFKVELKNEYGKLSLSMTHNGWQWTSILLRDPEYEIPLIISELRNHLSSGRATCSARQECILKYWGECKHGCTYYTPPAP